MHSITDRQKDESIMPIAGMAAGSIKNVIQCMIAVQNMQYYAYNDLPMAHIIMHAAAYQTPHGHSANKLAYINE